MDQAFRDAMTAGYALTEPGLVIGSPMHDGELAQRRAGPGRALHAQPPRPDRRRDRDRQDQDPAAAGRPAVEGRRAGLRGRHQGRPDRSRRTGRRGQPEGRGAGRVARLDVRAGGPPGRVPVADRASSAPRSGRRSTRSGRCCSARCSTSTRPRPRSSRWSSSTATTTTCRCSTSRTSRRRSSSSRRTRASRSSPSTAGCRARRSACCCARSSCSSRRAPTSSSASRSSTSRTCCARRPRARGSSASSSCRTSWTSRGCSRTFMLWMLAQLYESLPEAGDLPKPKLCFFFDEAHLLFDDASEALMDQVERTARLIRSKGVGVYFVTQAPTDVPSSVLAQLGNRVQHALRAFTPDDADALRKTARTFPMTEFYDVEKTITSLGTGEALVTVLSPRGVPTPLAATRLLAPDSLDGPDRRGPVPRPDRDEPVPGQVRRDRRPRQRPRADHRPARRRAGRRRRGGHARRRGADHGDGHEHDDAGPAATRDRAPGARDGRGAEGRGTRASGAGEGPARRRPGAAANDRLRPSGPAAGWSRRGSARTSSAACSARCSGAASPASAGVPIGTGGPAGLARLLDDEVRRQVRLGRVLSA